MTTVDSVELAEVRILLVEDDPVDRMAVERLFARESLPYRLVCAGTTAEALEMHREHPADLAILDHNLPDGTGLELQILLDDVPCFLIIGETDPAIAIQALKHDVLIKDSHMEQFPAAISRALLVEDLRTKVRRHADEFEEMVTSRTRELLETNEHLRQEITERREAEETLRGSELIVANSSDMLALLDRNYRYLTANPKYLSVVGLPPDQVIGSTVSEVLGEQAFKETVKPRMDQCLGGESVYYEDWFDFPESGKLYMTVTYHPRLDADDNVVGVIVNARDTTELEKARSRLGDLNLALEHMVEARTKQLVNANEELEAFAYSVSHDLKAPLRAIDGYSGMLEEAHGPSMDEEAQRLLSVVRSSAQQMAQLIDDLLEFARIGRVEMVVSPVDMKEIARLVFSDLLDPSRFDGGRRVDFRLGDLPTLPGDLALIRQVWRNLLQNALKFTERKEEARVEVDCTEESEHWVFRVRDNGAGFDMAFADRLFRVFERLHYQEEFPGSGVGLVTVRRIVQRHGGDVWAEGEVDVGATIFFRLPKRPVQV